ncbi:hypothetical protein EDM21_24220, partial [Paenibacillus sp. N10]|nr:hypothetical protein [Paenibacillus lutrae]
MKKKVNYLVLVCLLIQMLAPLNVINAMKAERPPTSTINSNQNLLTVESLSKAYGIAETEILAELTKGYTFLEVHTALQQEDAGQPLGELLKQLNPKVEEKLEQMDYSAERFIEQVDEKTNQVQTVTAQTYGEFVEDSGKTTFVHPSLLNLSDLPTVTDSAYGMLSSRTASSDKFPQSYDEFAVKRLNMNADRAPYGGSINDNVSTINGTLQMQSTDMSLPGRNGMSFTLNRNYNSSDAIYYNKKVIQDNVFEVIYYPKLTAKLFYKYSGDPVTHGSASDFYFQPYYFSWLYHSFVQFNGQYTYWSYPLNRAPIEDFNNQFREELESTYKFDPANPDASLFMIKDDLYLSGTPLMAKAYTTGKVEEYPNSKKPVCYYTDNFGNCGEFKYAYGNQVSEMSQEKRFPIGKGWSWDIPYIETKSDNKKYITLFGGSTYELDGLHIKGYPWKDLKLTYDGSVTVNDLTSSYVLTALDGQKQYFSSEGKLLQISDSYQNNIQFEYSYVSRYGTVLTKIKDALQNEIKIQYSSSEVTLSQGDRTVKYEKTKDPQGNKELLSQVTDPAGRKTQYVYEVASAPFDLVGSYKKKDNYVALLKQVYHPTNARTDFSYDSYNRSLGTTASETVYRVKAREDVITYAGGTESKSGRVDYTYQGDGGSVQKANSSFATTINNGRTQTTYSYDKVYIDDNTPEVFYNTQIKQDDGVTQTTTAMEYNRTNRWPSPTKTTTKTVQGASSSTEQVSQRTYDEYGNVLTETDPANAVSTYQYDAATHLLSSVTAPATSGLNSYMELERYPVTHGIKEVRVKENNAAGALQAHTSYTYDAFGNPTRITIKDDAQDIVVTNGYGTQYQSAFPTEQSVQVTDAAKQNTTVTQRFEYNPATGAMTKFTDGKGLVTQYEYDRLGRATKVTQPDSSTFRYTYNDAANEITTVDPTGVTQITKWNPLGWK